MSSVLGRCAKGGCGGPIAVEPVGFDVVATVVARMEGRRATLPAVRPAGKRPGDGMPPGCSLQVETLPNGWACRRAQVVRARGLLRVARRIFVVARSPQVSVTARATSRFSSASRRATSARSPATPRSMVKLAR
jgi:hypothetical protein